MGFDVWREPRWEKAAEGYERAGDDEAVRGDGRERFRIRKH